MWRICDNLNILSTRAVFGLACRKRILMHLVAEQIRVNIKTNFG